MPRYPAKDHRRKWGCWCYQGNNIALRMLYTGLPLLQMLLVFLIILFCANKPFPGVPSIGVLLPSNTGKPTNFPCYHQPPFQRRFPSTTDASVGFVWQQHGTTTQAYLNSSSLSVTLGTTLPSGCCTDVCLCFGLEHFMLNAIIVVTDSFLRCCAQPVGVW